jgi:hypothetical protein
MGLAMAREAKTPANKQGAQPAVVYASHEVPFRQAIGNDLRHGQLLAELIEAEPSLELPDRGQWALCVKLLEVPPKHLLCSTGSRAAWRWSPRHRCGSCLRSTERSAEQAKRRSR